MTRRSRQYPRVFTLGYQGLSIDEYVDALSDADVDVVLDVRETPWSRKPGFSKTKLTAALAKAGILYVHVKSAGNPAENRKTARTMAECLRRYREYLRSNVECLEELDGVLTKAASDGLSVCLTCFEREPEDCHRSVLLDELETGAGPLEPVHLYAT